MRLPPYPFPPEPGPQRVTLRPSIRGDAALLAAGIASVYCLMQLLNVPERADPFWATLAFGPLVVAGLFGAMLGRTTAAGDSLVGPVVGMTFAALFGELVLAATTIFFEAGATPQAAGLALAMGVFGVGFALFFVPIAAPCAVAWVLLLREVFGPQGSLDHLAQRTRQVCALLVATVVFGGIYVAATTTWFVPLDWPTEQSTFVSPFELQPIDWPSEEF